ncbi:MAG: pentapeptide repeat-containing protein [Okeania sp. SIO3I5]|uniref:pentapeptide repeat-containing protein n=1 Tax=Okeania sp. SIO3I5 TaxID=2607805 RepID=UPI0013B764F2|nr:pentapeptide repeat-containing protein [Okeania sp. SIO3I5]NEQ41571.1 pentapeptide repeat-containing protein [Okeania sp. SIO3I5]
MLPDKKSQIYSQSMNQEQILQQYTKGEKNFTGIILCEANLSKVNLNQINFSQAVLNLTNFSEANLSEANLNGAKLNVSRLTKINLTHAKLNGANLNLANLIQADLSYAELIEAKLIRAELIRANMSNANLKGANLIEADLREAILKQANLQLVDLHSAHLRNSCLENSNLERANLHRANLSKADLRGVNFSNAELIQANLSLSNLSQANLKGANLKGADLTGANLSGANLDSAILNSVNLYGANLHNSNLSNAVLVNADLTKSNLIHVSFEGADLTSATLTGSKLYGVSRFRMTAENITCDWVDMSVNGDGSKIINLTPEESQLFFNGSQPTVKFIVDSPLDHDAHLALAGIYRQIYKEYNVLGLPPNIEVNSKKTKLSIQVDKDEELFTTAYLMIYPFKVSTLTQNYFLELINKISQDYSRNLDVRTSNRFAKIRVSLNQVKRIIDELKANNAQLKISNLKFFSSFLKIKIINSRGEDFCLTNSFDYTQEICDYLTPKNINDQYLVNSFIDNQQFYKNLVLFVKNFS